MATIDPRLGYWIQFQLKLNGYTYAQLAEIANRSTDIISHFLRGRKDSRIVREVICKALGYESFEQIIADMPKISSNGDAA